MFAHIFNTFKKGIFVQIKHGRVEHFLNLDNEEYRNAWHEIIDFGEFKFTAQTQPPEKWYANNYLVRFERPFAESAIGRRELLDMFCHLCREVDFGEETVEFFVNRRDFPLLRKDGMHPYSAIFGGSQPCEAPQNSVVKLLSMVSSPEFSDVPIPTPEDWTRVSGRDFSLTKRARAAEFVDDFHRSWKEKRSVAVFRGGATGANFGALRVSICALVSGDPRFDAKITAPANRVQIVDGAIRHPPHVPPELLGGFLSLKEQSAFKFIIHIQGHVQAFRLSAELATHSVVLLVESDTHLWFEALMKPWVHFIPVKKDASDLKQKIEWALQNDQKCAQIAAAARAFYEKHLGVDACVQHLADILLPKKRQDIDSPILGESACFLRTICMKEDELFEKDVIRRTEAFAARVSRSGRLICKQFKELADAQREKEIAKWTNRLCQEIPNFLFTFSARSRGREVVQEFIGRPLSLAEYIKSQAFRFGVFLDILKQCFLALEHARVRCLFVHGALSPENVFLYKTFPRKEYDYITLPHLQVWRVCAEAYIPVIFDYSGASVYEQKDSRDAETLLAKSLFLAAKHRRISRAHEQQIAGMLGQSFVRNCIQGIVPEEETHSAMDLFSKIDRPGFSKVAGVKFTNFGKVASVYSLPKDGIALFRRYHQQLLSRMTIGGYSEKIIRALEPAENVCDGWTINYKEGERLAEKYFEPLNVCLSLLTDDSDFQLDQETRQELLEKIRKPLRFLFSKDQF